MSNGVTTDMAGVKNFLDILRPIDKGALNMHKIGGTVRRAEIDEIAEKARQIGREEGYEQGFATGKLEAYEAAKLESDAILAQERAAAIASFQAELNARVSEIGEQAENLVKELEVRVSMIAVEIAKKVIDQELETKPAIVLDWTKAALHELRLSNQVVIRVSEIDDEVLESAWEDLVVSFKSIGEIRKVVDPRVDRGVIVESDLGTVDASVETFVHKLTDLDEEVA